MGDVATDSDLAEGEVPTLWDRMHAAGLSAERIAVHAEANAIALDGELVRDLDRPAPPVTRWHFVGR
ncbi:MULTISPECIES: hypothetical protein [unclassified Pseudonocardia]|uniref:hypothetical protein n=1 Tax=unclassified Pseudonocardia TaxID=2619320 RepID=UPI0001FFDDCE|nr:hypothetical protein [Pseudonocardia sp. Ae707_Ps1]OLM09105.1 hypothetical protein Ae707Ps1_6052c [Pseudonocardia sp. Ae707_Ps1]